MATIITVRRTGIVVTRAAKQRTVTRIQKGDPGTNGLPGVLPMVDAPDDLTLEVKKAYRVTDTDEAILSLPALASIGDPIEVFGYGLGGWRIPVQAGKVIHILGGVSSTLSDGTDYLKSNSQFSMTRLRCIVTNDEWVAEIYDCSTK